MSNLFSNPLRLFVGLCFALILCWGLWLPIAAQTSPSPAAANVAGRYQVATNNNFMYFVDTQTGRMWWQSTANINNEVEWQELKSPLVP